MGACTRDGTAPACPWWVGPEIRVGRSPSLCDSGTWAQAGPSRPSWWPRFPPQTRQQGARWPAWERLRPSPSQARPFCPGRALVPGGSGGAWVPGGPRDAASVFLSFPRGTRGGACGQDCMAALDTEVPIVTDTRGGERGGRGCRADGQF